MTCAPATPQATVLLLHGGGFVFGGSIFMRAHCRELAAAGFRAVALDYPLGNLDAARRYTLNAARHWRRHGPVYAIGESAGGTLAALLAVEDRVDGAVAAGPLVNLLAEPTRQECPRWGRYCREIRHAGNRRAKRLISPALTRSHRSAPLVIIQDPQDPYVDFAQTLAFVRRRHIVLIRSHRRHRWPLALELRAFRLVTR